MRSAALVVNAAAIHSNCTAQSTAASVPAAVGQPDAVHTPGDALHAKRFLRTSPLDDDEERVNWFKSKLDAGSETFSKTKNKALVDKLNDPTFYSELVMADKVKLYETFASWKGLGITLEHLTASVTGYNQVSHYMRSDGCHSPEYMVHGTSSSASQLRGLLYS
ncbi:hypothetical protein PHYSODRAFT_288881 [Phytophthora sojae]|uniref:RxLR effector protein n=1 Tax=Phytophthora sojae (strain P6497) TaxID=1094619 RepID=G5A9T6_PHYSP|nr:hypothetical protein PHYSODRAFT_288881 [Phytophthora sojae]EGZ07366.1 hypothetical protein PHYSODRAFT_288881 [Phytophthora sojae]|eukprot:XP_009536932.1 hypothetical protein PHYSODRAFT_288881 [Phytophthora sojae]